jgi:mono/diheme cytochrome c family protein
MPSRVSARPRIAAGAGVLLVAVGLAACAKLAELIEPARPGAGAVGAVAGFDRAQVPAWTSEDLDFFLHGSMSTEVVPERVLHAFLLSDPDLFPRPDLSNFGLIPDPAFGWPVGVSRRPVPHLGGLSAVGVNCAACHVGEVVPAGGGTRRLVLGMTSHFDAEEFFGAATIATFRVASPAHMRRFLGAYLAAGHPEAGAAGQQLLTTAWDQQAARVMAALAADPFGAKDVAPGALHTIAPADLRLDRAGLASGMDLVVTVRALLRLFHNMRAALHIPDQPPEALPPASGPGRNDAFGLLSAALLGVPQPYAPVKYGLVWNLKDRRWVHWDGNTQSPMGRNVLAALGLGAPLLGRRGLLEVAAIRRHTQLTETIRAPGYPLGIDQAAARRGAATYRARCAACHDGPESDARLHALDTIGTDPRRAQSFTSVQANRFNRLLAGLEAPGYVPPGVPGLRGTHRYWAPSLAGVWARAPYLHNGSVRTLAQLLTPPHERERSFRRGAPLYEGTHVGFADAGPYLFDTTAAGNRNTGHDYGTDLPAAARRDLVEFLKTR